MKNFFQKLFIFFIAIFSLAPKAIPSLIQEVLDSSKVPLLEKPGSGTSSASEIVEVPSDSEEEIRIPEAEQHKTGCFSRIFHNVLHSIRDIKKKSPKVNSLEPNAGGWAHIRPSINLNRFFFDESANEFVEKIDLKKFEEKILASPGGPPITKLETRFPETESNEEMNEKSQEELGIELLDLVFKAINRIPRKVKELMVYWPAFILQNLHSEAVLVIESSKNTYPPKSLTWQEIKDWEDYLLFVHWTTQSKFIATLEGEELEDFNLSVAEAYLSTKYYFRKIKRLRLESEKLLDRFIQKNSLNMDKIKELEKKISESY